MCIGVSVVACLCGHVHECVHVCVVFGSGHLFITFEKKIPLAPEF